MGSNVIFLQAALLYMDNPMDNEQQRPEGK
jgi:hypothetical protein